jgi:hypothetical protein
MYQSETDGFLAKILQPASKSRTLQPMEKIAMMVASKEELEALRFEVCEACLRAIAVWSLTARCARAPPVSSRAGTVWRQGLARCSPPHPDAQRRCVRVEGQRQGRSRHQGRRLGGSGPGFHASHTPRGRRCTEPLGAVASCRVERD